MLGLPTGKDQNYVDDPRVPSKTQKKFTTLQKIVREEFPEKFGPTLGRNGCEIPEPRKRYYPVGIDAIDVDTQGESGKESAKEDPDQNIRAQIKRLLEHVDDDFILTHGQPQNLGMMKKRIINDSQLQKAVYSAQKRLQDVIEKCRSVEAVKMNPKKYTKTSRFMKDDPAKKNRAWQAENAYI